MPNYVTNTLKLKGTEEDIKQLLYSVSSVTVENGKTYNSCLDFNQILKMPEELNVTSGSITGNSIAIYLAEVENDFTKLNEVTNREWKNEDGVLLTNEEIIWKLKNEFGATAEVGKKYIDNYNKYGAYTWYEWRNANWGTKWNAIDSSYDNETKTITFDTAWSGVLDLIVLLSKRNPNIVMEYKYADENVGVGTGTFTISEGKIIKENRPRPLSKDAFYISWEVLGYDIAPKKNTDEDE